MKRIINIIFIGALVLLSQTVAGRSFPHFPYKGVENYKPKEKVKPAPKPKPAQAPTQATNEGNKQDAKEEANTTKPSTLAKSLNEVCSMLRTLGNMPATTDAQKAAKENYRDKISRTLNGLMIKYPNNRDDIQMISNHLGMRGVLSEPDDVSDAAGRVKERGSRYYCNEIVVFIKNIIRKL